MVLDWTTYCRVELHCEDNGVSGSCKIRVVDSSGPHFETSVVDFFDTTTKPTTKSDVLAKLESALAWQNTTYNVGTQAPASEYGHIELLSSNEEVSILVTSKVNGNLVTSPTTTLSLNNEGPFMDAVQGLFVAAHAFVVADKNLS